MSENVNHPQHYTETSLECIQVMRLIFGDSSVMVFCLITAFKYLWRFKNKNGVEDLNKAKWYLDKYKELSNVIARCCEKNEEPTKWDVTYVSLIKLWGEFVD